MGGSLGPSPGRDSAVAKGQVHRRAQEGVRQNIIRTNLVRISCRF